MPLPQGLFYFQLVQTSKKVIHMTQAQFKTLLLEYDFTYPFSDDHSAYKRGEAQQLEIIKAIKDDTTGSLERLYRAFLVRHSL